MATLACLPTLLIFSIAIALLSSVICSSDEAALSAGFLIVASLSLATTLPYGLGRSLTGAAPFSEHWLSLSPAYGALVVGTNFAYGRPYEFWHAATVTTLWSIIAFFAAEKVLKKRWRSAVELRLPLNGKIHQILSHGAARWQGALRSRLLEQNAFQWLAQRRQRPALLAWGGISLISFIWLLGWCAWPRAWPSTFNFFVTAMLLLIFEQMLEMYSAAHQIGEDRRNGNLELLLTTPLTPSQILAGQLDALEQQFRVVRCALCGIFLLMAVAGFLMRSWTPSALILYLAIWSLFLSWPLRRRTAQTTLAIWVALNTGRPAFAIFRSQSFGWQWFWIFYNGSQIRSALGSGATAQFPTGSLAEYCAFGFVAFLLLIIYAVRWKDPALLRERFLDNMRSIAQEPVPSPQDERLKRWKDVRELLPSTAK